MLTTLPLQVALELLLSLSLGKRNDNNLSPYIHVWLHTAFSPPTREPEHTELSVAHPTALFIEALEQRIQHVVFHVCRAKSAASPDQDIQCIFLSDSSPQTMSMWALGLVLQPHNYVLHVTLV